MISTLKSKTNINRMVFLDTETAKSPIPKGSWGGTGKPTLAILRLGWMCLWNKGGENWYEFKTIEDFFRHLEGFIGRGRRPVFIYTYNASFDYQVLGIIKQVSTRKGWSYNRAPIVGNVFIFGANYLGSEVWFLDMGNHLGVKRPLAEIGGDMGISKLEVNRKKIDELSDEILSSYCRRDTEIVREYMIKWFHFLVDCDLGAYRPTLAGQCITAYRHRFMETPIYIHNIPAVSVLERASYRGGRNESFFIGKVDEPVYKMDVNSFHPFIMRNLPLPFKLIRAGEYISTCTLDQCVKEGKQFIISAEVKCDIHSRCISIRGEVRKGSIRSIYPVGRFRAVITSLEYEQLQRYGGRVDDVTSYALYESNVLFRRYIDYFYKKRLYYRSVRDKTMDNMSKYFMNSLEGKLAQHSRQIYIVNHKTKLKDGDYVVVDNKTRDTVIYHVYGGKEWVSAKEKTEGYNVFVAIPSFIRAYTRCILFDDFNTIKKEGGRVYYCDTDSIFCDERGKDALSDAGKIDKDVLGAYKIEGVANGTIFRGCKDYYFEGEDHIKGIRKDAVLENSVYKQTHFCKMPAMLQRGISEGVIIVDGFEKRPTREYLKGVVPKGGGWVKPLVLP